MKLLIDCAVRLLALVLVTQMDRYKALVLAYEFIHVFSLDLNLNIEHSNIAEARTLTDNLDVINRDVLAVACAPAGTRQPRH